MFFVRSGRRKIWSNLGKILRKFHKCWQILGKLLKNFTKFVDIVAKFLEKFNKIWSNSRKFLENSHKCLTNSWKIVEKFHKIWPDLEHSLHFGMCESAEKLIFFAPLCSLFQHFHTFTKRENCSRIEKIKILNVFRSSMCESAEKLEIFTITEFANVWVKVLKNL